MKGAVWVNDRKESDRHPDYRGSAMVGGVEYWLSAWAADGSNPKAPVLKFSFSQKEAVAQAGIAQTRQATGIGVQPVAGAARPAAAMPDAFDSEDIPF
jgi:hypothetical protein